MTACVCLPECGSACVGERVWFLCLWLHIQVLAVSKWGPVCVCTCVVCLRECVA